MQHLNECIEIGGPREGRVVQDKVCISNGGPRPCKPQGEHEQTHIRQFQAAQLPLGSREGKSALGEEGVFPVIPLSLCAVPKPVQPECERGEQNSQEEVLRQIPALSVKVKQLIADKGMGNENGLAAGIIKGVVSPQRDHIQECAGEIEFDVLPGRSHKRATNASPGRSRETIPARTHGGDRNKGHKLGPAQKPRGGLYPGLHSASMDGSCGCARISD